MPSIVMYYDEESDVAYFKLSEKPIAFSKVIDDDRWADYASDNSLVGLQMFAASKRLPFLKDDLKKERAALELAQA